MKAALIQMRNVPEKQENLDRAARLIRCLLYTSPSPRDA